MPQVGTVDLPPDPERGIELAMRPRLFPRGDRARAVVRMQGAEPAAAVTLRLGLAGEVEPLRAGPAPVAEIRRPPQQLRHTLDEAAPALGLLVRLPQTPMQVVHVVRPAEPVGGTAQGLGRAGRDRPVPAIRAIPGTANAVLDAMPSRRRRRRPGPDAAGTVVRMDRIEPAEPEAVRRREARIGGPLRSGPAPFTGSVARERQVGQGDQQVDRTHAVSHVAQSEPLSG